MCLKPRLGDHVDHIHPEAAHTFLQPEVHQFIHLLPDFGIFPIQVRLLFREHVEVVLACGFVEGPCRATESSFPVGGFAAIYRIVPNVVVVKSIVSGASGLLEPLVFI